jgi:late competence protein required for DNA uptake (superfamily II DNA/RNA helicase)
MSIIQPDTQQTQIIQAIQNHKNISINAVFGSGKTTTILRSVQDFPDKNSRFILIIPFV